MQLSERKPLFFKSWRATCFNYWHSSEDLHFMLSDPVDVCGNELGRVEDRRLGAGYFQGQKAYWGGRGTVWGGRGAVIHMQCRRSLCITTTPPPNPRRTEGGDWWNAQEGLIKGSQLKRIDVLHLLCHSSIGLPGRGCRGNWVPPNKLNK